jgi:glycerol kinase
VATKEHRYIVALDQGTTSTRCILFDRRGQPVCSEQLEHRQHYPRPGWVEHDPLEIWERTGQVIRRALSRCGAGAAEIQAVGITNQRETTLVWNPESGEPYGNALVWQDTRTAGLVGEMAAGAGIDRFRERTGLPLATYFSAPKLRWLLENTPGLRRAAERGKAVFGTVDSWLIWQLTGGPRRGRHVTELTNASRTLLLDLRSLAWDPELLRAFGVPPAMLPEILPSVPLEPYGFTTEEGPFGARIPVAGALGDQQAALFGQACFAPGSCKNTYGTGCFLLLNTGERLVASRHGLISTVGYRLGSQAPCYALEGSVAIAGALVQWLRDSLGLIGSSGEVEALARRVEDSGGVYFVPAFSGLFAPYWRADARGLIAGLSSYSNRAHLARAVLEATAFQTREIFEAMEQDASLRIPFLKADGGMVVNGLLMQFQADQLGVPVILPEVTETTALGAAYAAGLATGFWQDLEELGGLWRQSREWQPAMAAAERQRRYHMWKKAVGRSLDWLEG